MKSTNISAEKPSLLCIVHLPPPIHGVTVMSQAVVNSYRLKSFFDLSVLPIRFATSISDIGRLNLKKFITMFGFSYRILSRCVNKKPELVYFTLTPAGISFYRDLIYVIILKISKVRHVFHLHGKGVAHALNHPLNKILYNWTFKNARVIVLSPALYDDIDQVVRKENCFFLANGIPDPYAGQNDRSFQKERHDPPVLLYFSTMIASKGPFVFLEALGHLKRLGIAFKALFAGEWGSSESRETFFSLVLRHDLMDTVQYCGPKYESEKYDLFRKADIFVFPTYNEAFGLVVLEAMSHALPVVASNEGAIPDMVVDGVNGFLVPKKDAEALAYKLTELLKDVELRSRFGEAGRKRFLESFSQEIFETNLLKALQWCVDAQPNR